MTDETTDPRLCPCCGQPRPHTGLTSSATMMVEQSPEDSGFLPASPSPDEASAAPPGDAAFDFKGVPIRLSSSQSGESLPTAAIVDPRASAHMPLRDSGDLVAAAPPTEPPGTAPSRHASPFRWLLASYASALTLAMIWMLATGRIQLRPPASRLGAGPQAADFSPTPLAEIPAGFTIPIGGNLRVGDLDITPVEVRLRDVRLRREVRRDDDDEVSRRPGGSNALWLRLHVRNLNTERSLRPLEPGFVRTTDQGGSESVIQGESGRIETYPLAVASEWAILGQEFPKLKPGEEADLWIVSTPDSVERLDPAMTWRSRLRVAEDRTELLGFEFRRSDLRVASPSS